MSKHSSLKLFDDTKSIVIATNNKLPEDIIMPSSVSQSISSKQDSLPSITDQAKKALTVKSDESGYEYTTIYSKDQVDDLLGDKKDKVTTGTVSNIIHSISGRNVSIKWTDPTDTNWSKTILIRKIGSYPTSQADGTVILNSSVKNQYSQNSYVDTLPSDANFTDQYHYRLFAVSTDNLANKSSNDSFYHVREQLTTGVATNVSNTVSRLSIDIKWTDPTDSNWYNTVLIRKLGSQPTSSSDGTVIVTETVKNSYSSTAYTDTLPSDATTAQQYYYKLFTISVDNVINSDTASFYVSKVNATTGVATSVSSTINRLTVNINWTDPSDANWSKTVLVRKASSAPTSASDGTVVVTETTKNSYSSTSYVDTLPSDSTNGQNYYYKLFTVSIDDVTNSNTDSFYVTRVFLTTGTVSDISYTDNTSSVDIKWTDPTDSNWYSTTVVRKLGSAPSSISDGTVVLTETVKNSYNSTAYTDTLPSDASSSNVYYYRLFTASIDSVVNTSDNSFSVSGATTLSTFRTQLANGTINSSNIGETFTITHTTYGDIQMQIVAYDDATLATGESATHTVTLLSKDIICKKQFDSAQNQYALTEDTVYRPDAIIMFNTSSTYAVSNTNNYLIDDISKTGTQRSWTSFNGQYVIKYNSSNSRWERGTLTSATAYTMNYYLGSTDITSGTWLDSSSNSSSYIVTYIKKYYTLSGSTYTQESVTLGNSVDSNIYEMNPTWYADSSHSRTSYGYNRYSQSGIRQWLNGSGSNWWSKQNLFDNAPTYSTEAGFMDGLPSDFKSALATVQVTTTLNYKDSQGYNGYKYDITEDKIFLPSYTEMFNSNNYSAKPQGNYWSYFDSSSKRVKYYDESEWYWWLRSAYPSHAYYVRDVDYDGLDSYSLASNSLYGVAFACVIKSI